MNRTAYYPLGRAEDMSEGQYQSLHAIVHEPEDAPTGMWQRREGDLIPIADMTDAHLDNTIEMLRRNNATAWHKYRELLVEKKRRTT